MPFLRICSLILFKQKYTNFSPYGAGLLQFQIWAESTKLFLRYVPSNFILFSSYFSSFQNTWNQYNLRVLQWIALKLNAILEHIYDSIFVVQVLAIEFVAFAIEFIPLANEFVTLAIEFIHLAIEFVPWAIEFVALARKFVMTEEASRNQPLVSGWIFFTVESFTWDPRR